MKYLIIIVLLLLLIGGGVFVFFTFLRNQNTQPVSQQTSTVPTETTGAELPTGKPKKIVHNFEGRVIAGSYSPYIEFTKSDYDKAVSENKIIFLNFVSGDCQPCEEEAPVLQEGFNELNNENLIGFRLDVDGAADVDERALAEQFGVTEPQTKVIVRNGDDVFKETASWNIENMIQAFGQHTN